MIPALLLILAAVFLGYLSLTGRLAALFTAAPPEVKK